MCRNFFKQRNFYFIFAPKVFCCNFFLERDKCSDIFIWKTVDDLLNFIFTSLKVSWAFLFIKHQLSKNFTDVIVRNKNKKILGVTLMVSFSILIVYHDQTNFRVLWTEKKRKLRKPVFDKTIRWNLRMIPYNGPTTIRCLCFEELEKFRQEIRLVCWLCSWFF